MNRILLAGGMLASLLPTVASAQPANLTGVYRCVQMCRSGQVGGLAYVTQNGPNLNVLDEAGMPSRAWPDWYAPATRIWVENRDEGAVYSPDAMLIQFDRGTIWHRDLGPPPPTAVRRRR